MKASALKSLLLGPLLSLALGAAGFCNSSEAPKGENLSAHLGPNLVSHNLAQKAVDSAVVHAAPTAAHGPQTASPAVGEAAQTKPQAAAAQDQQPKEGTLEALAGGQDAVVHALAPKEGDVPAEDLSRTAAEPFGSLSSKTWAPEEPASRGSYSDGRRIRLSKKVGAKARARGLISRAAAKISAPARPAWYTEALALKLSIGVGLTLAVVEGVGAAVIGSASAQADALHLAGDRVLDGLNLLSPWLSRRLGVNERKLDPVLGLVSATVVFGMAGGSLLRAVHGIFAPPAVLDMARLGGGTMALAVVGLASNAISALLLYPHREESSGALGVFYHAAGDAFGSAMILAAGWLIKRQGWTAADPIANLVIAVLIARMGWELAKTSLRKFKAANAAKKP